MAGQTVLHTLVLARLAWVGRTPVLA